MSSMLPSLPKLSGGVVGVLPSQGSLNIQGNGETTTQVSTANGDKFSKLEAGKRWWLLRKIGGGLRKNEWIIERKRRWRFARWCVVVVLWLREAGCPGQRPDVRAGPDVRGTSRMSGVPEPGRTRCNGGFGAKIRRIFRMKFGEKWRKS